MAGRIQIRRGTAAAATAANQVLANGEFGYETDTRRLKVGDGTTAWNSLPYMDAAAVSAVAGLAAHLADTTDAHLASSIGFTPTATISATNLQAAIVEVDAEHIANDVLTANGNLVTRVAGVPGEITRANLAADPAFSGRFVPATVTNGRAVIQQPDYPVDVETKGGYAALTILGYDGSTANKAPLQLYSAKTSAQGEDVLFSVDYAGSAFPGPITVIKTDGGIESGAYLVISGHALNAGSSSGYKRATYKRTMATVWTDTPGATANESNAVLSLRNVGAAYPAGDAGNCDVLLIVEDVGNSVVADGIERLSIRPKGDIYQMHTDHTVDWFNATNYERAHLGWDRPNSRYVVETQAGGTGTRRELLVKDRKFLTASAPGTISATTNALIWPVPRACVIKSVKFSSLTPLTINGAAFWRVAATKYTAGAYVGDIINVGNDSIALSSGAANDLGAPSATHGVLAAGDVMRVFFNRAVGAPPAIDCPTVVIEWEPI